MSVKDTLLSIARSWCETEGKVRSTAEILDWIRERNENTYVSIRPISLEQCEPWYYDSESGRIQNRNLSFFQIAGLKQEKADGSVAMQPVIAHRHAGSAGSWPGPSHWNTGRSGRLSGGRGIFRF